MPAQWLANQRVPGRIKWPHTWKKRRKVANEAQRSATERSDARVALRRARAREDEFDYNETPKRRKRAHAQPAAPRKQARPNDNDDKQRGGRHGKLKLMIRMSAMGVRAVEESLERQRAAERKE